MDHNEDRLNPFEVRFDDGQQTIVTVAHAKAVADALLERCRNAAEEIRIIQPDEVR